MKAEGECPDCGKTVGVRIAGSLSTMFGDTIERVMDREGNAMRCTGCEEYVEPDGVSIET